MDSNATTSHRRGGYAWLVTYAGAQGGDRQIRALIVASLVMGAIAFTATLWSSAGPQSDVGRWTLVAGTSVGVLSSVFWLGREWPSKNRSICFIIIVTLATASNLLSGISPTVALPLCAAFNLICGYAAMFHSVRVLAFVTAIALCTAVALCIAIYPADPVIMCVQLGFVVTIMTAGPLTANWWIHQLGLDLRIADTDSLTGLLDRRGFHLRTNELIDLHKRDLDHHLVLLLLDLDGFKQLNDTQGHAHGDRALIAISDTIRTHTRQHAVIARAGGDEFLIADITDSAAKAAHLADRLCTAINTTPPHLTASIGLASIRIADLLARTDDVIEHLTHDADTAMYEAKRAGGNQLRFTAPPQET